jgi:hypothetical protein
MKNVDDIIEELLAEERAKVLARVRELIGEETTLQRLCKARRPVRRQCDD